MEGMETKKSHQTPLIPAMEPSGVHSLLSFLWNFILLLKSSINQHVHLSLNAFPSEWSRDLGLIPLPMEPCGTEMTLIDFEMNGNPVGYWEEGNLVFNSCTKHLFSSNTFLEKNITSFLAKNPKQTKNETKWSGLLSSALSPFSFHNCSNAAAAYVILILKACFILMPLKFCNRISFLNSKRGQILISCCLWEGHKATQVPAEQKYLQSNVSIEPGYL